MSYAETMTLLTHKVTPRKASVSLKTFFAAISGIVLMQCNKKRCNEERCNAHIDLSDFDVGNGGNWWKIVENDGNCWKIVENDRKWWKIVENDRKWWKIVENDRKWWNNGQLCVGHTA